MKDIYFKNLSAKEEEEFRRWARENYSPGQRIQYYWHPVVRQECAKINEEIRD